jgi:hypothetical protein
MIDKTLAQTSDGDKGYRWYSWDSPLGLGIFFVCLSAVAVLVHVAIVLR